MTVVGPDGTHWPADSLRGIEHASIRRFVQQAADDGYLSGRVLDYGCGKQPYREIVKKAGGEYRGYDRADFPANKGGDVGESPWPGTATFDAILCNQVLQYVPDPLDLLNAFGQRTEHLVLTYPTNWPEVEPEDLHRFTKAGMERLLTESGFEIVCHERRAEVTLNGEAFALGYGVIARA